MQDWKRIIELAQTHGLHCRVKAVDEELPDQWGKVFMPTDGYIEGGGTGPVPFKDIEWIDLQTSVIEHIGRLLPARIHDKRSDISASLLALQATFTEHPDYVRVLTRL